MHTLKFSNTHQYLHKHTWFHELSPQIKIYSMILWFILSFHCPLIIFCLVLFTLILLNFYLQLSAKTFSSYNLTISHVHFLKTVSYILIILALSHITYQHPFLAQITQTKTNCKHTQYYLLINKIHTQNFISNIIDKVLISYFLFKQYIILISFLYFCRLLEITTYEEELTIAYLSLFGLSKHNSINKLFFCFSITKQYEYLVIDKITNILCTLKFRYIDSHQSGLIFHFTHLTIFYLEIFINKLLIYSQIISECLYSRELIPTK